MRLDNIHTHVPKLDQCSIYRFNVGRTVVNTAIPMEAENPSSEQKRAMYLGKAAEYRFCVSSVAMPSSSWYNLEVSSGASPFVLNVALLEIFRKVGIEVANTNIKAIKPTTAEAFGKPSMGKNGEKKSAWKWRA